MTYYELLIDFYTLADRSSSSASNPPYNLLAADRMDNGTHWHTLQDTLSY